jgi:hypothetical protein
MGLSRDLFPGELEEYDSASMLWMYVDRSSLGDPGHILLSSVRNVW